MDGKFQFVRQIPEKFLSTKPELRVQLNQLETLIKFKRNAKTILLSALDASEKLAEFEKLLNVDETSDQPTNVLRNSVELGHDVMESPVLSQLPAGCKPGVDSEGDPRVQSNLPYTLAEASTAVASDRGDTNNKFDSRDTDDKWIHLDRCHSLLASNNL